MISYHAHGGDVYRHQNVTDFSANCNPFGTPESVKQAVARAMEQVCPLYGGSGRADHLRKRCG